MDSAETEASEGRRFFTVEEANRSLPRVAHLMETLQRRYRWLEEHKQEPRYLLAEYRIVDEGPVDPDYLAALVAVRRGLREMGRIGAQVKDVRSGLVDFPSRMDGREVLLCWRVGESKVGYWHDLESGFSGRRPLPPSAQEPEPGGGGGN